MLLNDYSRLFSLSCYTPQKGFLRATINNGRASRDQQQRCCHYSVGSCFRCLPCPKRYECMGHSIMGCYPDMKKKINLQVTPIQYYRNCHHKNRQDWIDCVLIATKMDTKIQFSLFQVLYKVYYNNGYISSGARQPC